jgi:predicted enzyme related to lactoylglutathione lyase
MNSVVHFEVPVSNPEQNAFYRDAFGWQIQTVPMGAGDGGTYTIASTTETDQTTQLPKQPGAINGGLIKRDDKFTAPILTVGVDDVDEAVQKVEAAGGKESGPRATIAGVGEYTYVTDPDGNLIGLWRDLQPQA